MMIRPAHILLSCFPKAQNAKKFGEEAVEVVLASLDRDEKHLVAEAADVFYHLLVLLKSRNIPLSAVMEELDRRTSQSGLQEKASRK